MRCWLWLAVLAIPGAQACTTATDSIGVSVNHHDFGDPGSVVDDCVLLDTGRPASAGAKVFDLRLSPCAGHPTGSHVQDADIQETTAAYGQVATQVSYADVDSNGRYTSDDAVFLRTGTGTGLPASTSASTWSLRLTASGGHAAGTYVFAGDPDHAAHSATAQPWPTASVAWCDFDGSVTYTDGDVAYIIPRAAGFPAGNLVPLGSLRITQAPSTGSTSAAPTPSPTPPSGSSTESATSAANVSDSGSSGPSGGGAGSNGAPGASALLVACALLAAARKSRP